MNSNDAFVTATNHYVINDSFNAGEYVQIARYAYGVAWTVVVDGQNPMHFSVENAFQFHFSTSGTHTIDMSRDDLATQSWLIHCAVPPTVSLSVSGGPTSQPATYAYGQVVPTSFSCTPDTNPIESCVDDANPVVICPGRLCGLTSGTGTLDTSTVGFHVYGVCTSDTKNFGDCTGFQYRVVPASQRITFTSAAPSAATFGTTYTPAATSTSGLPVTFSVAPTTSGVCSLSGGVVSMIGVGSCTVYADQAGNTDYDAAQRVAQTFNVDRAGTRLSATPATKPLLGLAATRFTATLTRSDNAAPISGQTITFTVSTVTCQGVTNASGVATCSKALGPFLWATARTFSASYAGGADYKSSATTGALKAAAT